MSAGVIGFIVGGSLLGEAGFILGILVEAEEKEGRNGEDQNH